MIEIIYSRINQTEESIKELKGGLFEKRMKIEEYLWELWGSIKTATIWVARVRGELENVKGVKILLKEEIAENFSNIEKETNIQF
jgi:hypothetical protein